MKEVLGLPFNSGKKLVGLLVEYRTVLESEIECHQVRDEDPTDPFNLEVVRAARRNLRECDRFIKELSK